LCNAYSLESQIRAGWGLVGLAATLGTVWLLGIVVEGATRLTDQRVAPKDDVNTVQISVK